MERIGRSLGKASMQTGRSHVMMLVSQMAKDVEVEGFV